jgi:hypothetical protein
MINKKMKGVYDGTAAVGQAQARGDEKKTTVDTSQYSNLIMSLDNWMEVEANCRALLQHQVGPTEEAARKMLALGSDAPADERRRAEKLLIKCGEQRSALEERLDRAVRQIEGIKLQIAPLLAEVQRQQKIRSVAAGLR